VRTDNPPQGVFHAIKQDIETLKKRANRLANQKTPTVPQYDLPLNPPPVSIEGQLANDLVGKLWWFLDGEWRTC